MNWLCARLPAWITPDMLTTIGFLGACTSAAGYALSTWRTEWLWLAIAGYFINWFGDSLDGSLARFRKIVRPKFGYFIDHSTDSMANLILIAGLGLSPYVRFDVAMFGIAGYLLLSIHTFLAARVLDEFRLSYIAAGPTELRLMLIAMTGTMLALGPQPMGGGDYTVFDAFVGTVGSVLIVLYLVQTITTARRLK